MNGRIIAMFIDYTYVGVTCTVLILRITVKLYVYLRSSTGPLPGNAHCLWLCPEWFRQDVQHVVGSFEAQNMQLERSDPALSCKSSPRCVSKAGCKCPCVKVRLLSMAPLWVVARLVVRTWLLLAPGPCCKISEEDFTNVHPTVSLFWPHVQVTCHYLGTDDGKANTPFMAPQKLSQRNLCSRRWFLRKAESRHHLCRPLET